MKLYIYINIGYTIYAITNIELALKGLYSITQGVALVMPNMKLV